MPVTPAQLPVLKNELINDPKGLGYAPLYANGQDADLATMINLVREGGDYQVDNDPVLPRDVVKAITQADLDALTPTALQKLTILFLLGTLDLSDATTRGLLASIFPPGGGTRTALSVLSKRQGTRGEVLFASRGIRVTASDVAAARNQP